ncbi:MAG TPA: hypothetical protein VL422_13560 [Miltoncostaea sp.]|nr:hypothetical protein [Miltoncostaea sp.]
MRGRGTGRRRSLAVALVAAVAAALVPALSGCAAGPDPVAAAQPAPGDLDLSAAPWINVPDGNDHIGTAEEWPSLRFAPGITYAGALERLFVAARTGAPQVADAEVMPPLPREVVYVAPADDAGGLRLSLLAPWGWRSADGAIGLPSFNLPGDLAPEEATRRVRDAEAAGLPLPEGARVDVPELPPCEIGIGTPDARPRC